MKFRYRTRPSGEDLAAVIRQLETEVAEPMASLIARAENRAVAMWQQAPDDRFEDLHRQLDMLDKQLQELTRAGLRNAPATRHLADRRHAVWLEAKALAEALHSDA